MDQHEITREIPLLNADGDLTEPGYAKKLLPVYRRGTVAYALGKQPEEAALANPDAKTEQQMNRVLSGYILLLESIYSFQLK